MALSGGQGPGERPREGQVTTGARFYDASVFTVGDTQDTNRLVSQTQSYLYPLDNTPAMGFLLP